MTIRTLARLGGVVGMLVLAGCASFNPPPLPEPEGPKVPINSLSTEDQKKLRFANRFNKIEPSAQQGSNQ